MELYGVPGTKTAFRPPIVEVADPVGRISGPDIRQYGNGYFMLYYINVKSGWDDDRALLRISLTEVESGNLVFHGPELAVHVRIAARIVWIIAIVATLAIGSFLASLEKETLQLVLESVTSAPTATAWSKVGLLPLKGLGAMLIALGAFWGFRKLPGPAGG